MKSQNKGITLVALIITIVVLLILATVTLRGIQGEEIVDKAHETKEGVENLQTEEEIRFAVLKLQDIEETVEDKAEWLRNELHGATVTEGTNRISIKYKGVIASLNIDYQIEDFLKTEEEKLEFQIEEDIQFALLKFQDMGETVEDKPQWLRSELNAALSVGEDRIIVSYKGYKIVLDSNYSIQDMFTTDEWDSTATPENVFVWGSDDPTSADYGTVIGYEVAAKSLENKTLKYPSRCTKIMDASETNTHYNVVNIEKVEIPSTVVSFGDKAFYTTNAGYGFKNLKEVIIEEGVTRLSSSMFFQNISLENITIPKSIISIGASAFERCTKMKNITVPDSVISIGSRAFYDCSNLEAFIIPNSVTEMGGQVFVNCSNIKSIIIPESVTTMGAFVFTNWTSDQIVYVYFNSESERPSGWVHTWRSNSSRKVISVHTGEAI